MRTLSWFVVGAIVLSAGAARAQQPVVEVQASMQAPMQPPPPQPMRYILANGSIVIGTQAGGDAEWLLIQTSTGVVQVRRAEIASMDYQVGQGAVAVVAAPPPQPVMYAPQPPPRRRGRGLIIAGSILFGVSYGLPALVGLTASQESPTALWFILPVAGPLIWAQTTCDGEGEWEDGCKVLASTFGVFLTAIQAAGLVMLIVGMSMRSSSDQPQAEGGLRLAGDLQIAPVLTPGYEGLALSSAF